MAEKYMLRVTAGPSYDSATHVEVPVNDPTPLKVRSDLADIELSVRIQGYHGLPLGSPSTSPYFSSDPHAYNQDQYSIALRFSPHERRDDSGRSEQAEVPGGISGHDLQFGNDFDRPIRDKLPPGFNTALSIVRWWIDPGLDGDAYADKPYLYGPALSSFNSIHVGQGLFDKAKGGLWFEEGGDEEGMQYRARADVPEDRKARMKWALKDDSKTKWVFQYGKTYGLDFFNPYIDFNTLSLKLPGFHLPIVKYWDGQGLRYVLRNKSSAEIYLVVVFTIYLREDVNEDGSLKEGAAERACGESSITAEDGASRDEGKALDEARRQLGHGGNGIDSTSPNDVD